MDHVSLVVESGAAKGRSVSVRGDRLVIGRDPSCRLRLGSATVSRVHAEIGRLGGALILRDLRSSNGTRLNGRLLRGEEAGLADGDRIEVGSIALRVSIRPEPATAAVLARPEIEDQVSSWLGDAPHADPAADPATLADLPAFEADDVADSAAPDADEPVKHEVIEDVLVVTPLVPDLVAEPAIGPLRARLDDLLHSELPMRVVVNLSHVGQISGSAIGVLVAHHLQLDRSGGSLKVCEMNPRVAAVLDQVRLGMIVPCTPTVDEAVLGAWDRPRDAAG